MPKKVRKPSRYAQASTCPCKLTSYVASTRSTRLYDIVTVSAEVVVQCANQARHLCSADEESQHKQSVRDAWVRYFRERYSQSFMNWGAFTFIEVTAFDSFGSNPAYRYHISVEMQDRPFDDSQATYLLPEDRLGMPFFHSGRIMKIQ